MTIKTEILKKHISDHIIFHINDFEINADEVVNTVAIEVLQQIQDIIKDDETTDFEKIESIVLLFEKNNIDSIPCHDF